MEKNHGIYIGMVVQNNDPEKRGRIKVFVPHISSNVYSRWNDSEVDQKFSNPSEDIAEIMPRLKATLPWSEAAMPILSTGTSYIYNTSTNNVDTEKNSYKSLNYSKTDQWNNDYSDNDYDETTRGTYNVPDVGSRVLIFFREGNPLYPIYFSQIYTENDWNKIFSETEYPNGHSNNTASSEKYQSKLIIKRRGGLFEIVDSDGYEKVRLQHRNGTYTTFNNNGYNIFTPENYNSLVFKDFYSTIRGEFKQTVYKDFWQQVKQNQTEFVGETVDESKSYSVLESGLSIPTSVLLDKVSAEVNSNFNKLQILSLSSDVGKGKQTNAFNWDVIVGSGGINFITTGKFQLESPYQLFSSEYLESVSKVGLKLEGKTYAHIISPKIILEGKTFISNSLDVKNNVKIGGGLNVAGETVLQHVTAPLSFQVTESTKIQAMLGKWNIKNAIITSNQGTFTNVTINGIFTLDQPHTHYFANIPITLLNTYGLVYDKSNAVSDDISNPSDAIVDGKSTNQTKSSNYNGPSS